VRSRVTILVHFLQTIQKSRACGGVDAVFRWYCGSTLIPRSCEIGQEYPVFGILNESQINGLRSVRFGSRGCGRVGQVLGRLVQGSRYPRIGRRQSMGPAYLGSRWNDGSSTPGPLKGNFTTTIGILEKLNRFFVRLGPGSVDLYQEIPGLYFSRSACRTWLLRTRIGKALYLASCKVRILRGFQFQTNRSRTKGHGIKFGRGRR
jgi:hypothetical protein